MLKKYLSFVVAILISTLLFQTITRVHAQTNQNAQSAANIKADVASIGVGARVSVKLRDKAKLVGYISQIGEQDFVVTKAKEGTKQTIAYADVNQVKVSNEKRISTAGKILIVMGVLTVLSLIGNKGFGG